jgi:hypothetical protein
MTDIKPIYNNNGNFKQALTTDNLNIQYVNNIDPVQFNKATYLTGQTIDGGLSVKDPAYYDVATSSWKKATIYTVVPQGIYVGSNVITLEGYVSGLTGLTAGTIYYMADAGGLTTTAGNRHCRVCYALSTTEVIVNILDNEIREAPYGFYCGSDVYSNIIDYISLVILNTNAIDTGDLTIARGYSGGVVGTTYGFIGGGTTGTYSNVIDYIILAVTTQNATDTGDLTQVRYGIAGVSGSTYGFFGGGIYFSGSIIYSNIIDYIAIGTTTQNATDTGDLTISRYFAAGVSGPTYGFFGGGTNATAPVWKNTIDYITLATTTQNATDTGDLTVSRGLLASVSGSTYGFFGGGMDGAVKNTIDYITLATTTQNATDTGDLSIGRQLLAGVNGTIYGFFGGGAPGVDTDTIDYITLATTTQNATDTGDLTGARAGLTGI